MRYGQGSLVLLTVVAIFGMSSSYRSLEMQRALDSQKVEHGEQLADLRRKLERLEREKRDVLTLAEKQGSQGELVQGIKQAYGIIKTPPPKGAPVAAATCIVP